MINYDIYCIDIIIIQYKKLKQSLNIENIYYQYKIIFIYCIYNKITELIMYMR